MIGFIEFSCACLILFLIALVSLDFYWRRRPAYIATTKIPGNHVYPIVGSLLDVLPLNSSEAAFKQATIFAKHFKQAYRFYLFGVLHYWPIRAAEIEVSRIGVRKAKFMLTPRILYIYNK